MQDFQNELITQLKRDDDEQVQEPSGQNPAMETTCWAENLQGVAELLLKFPGYDAAWKTFNKLSLKSQGTLKDKIAQLREKKV